MDTNWGTDSIPGTHFSPRDGPQATIFLPGGPSAASGGLQLAPSSDPLCPPAGMRGPFFNELPGQGHRRAPRDPAHARPSAARLRPLTRGGRGYRCRDPFAPRFPAPVLLAGATASRPRWLITTIVWLLLSHGAYAEATMLTQEPGSRRRCSHLHPAGAESSGREAAGQEIMPARR